MFHRSSFAEASFPEASWRVDGAVVVTPVQPIGGGGAAIGRRRGRRRVPLVDPLPDIITPHPGVSLLPEVGPLHDPLPSVPGMDAQQRRRRRLARLVAIGALRH